MRSLAAKGIEPIVVSEKGGVPAAASRFVERTEPLPDPRDDFLAYRDALLALAERFDVDSIYPLRPEDGYLLSRYVQQFEAHVSLVVPPMDALERVHDRLALAAAAEAAGVPVPETKSLDDVDDWSGRHVVKSRYNVLADAYFPDRSPEDVDVVKAIEHLPPAVEPDRAETVAAFDHVPIVQEFVPKDGEYMVAALYDHGDPVATFQHLQIRGDSYTGGGGVYRRSIRDPELASVAHDLLAELEWHGLACIEYMRDARTGEYVLTEINPRFWQSLPSTVRAGADFPWYYYLLATGRGDEIEPSYRTGLGSHLLHGELGHLMSVRSDESPLVDRPSFVGTAAAIAGSCLVEPRFDYLRLDDPAPFLHGIRTKLRRNR
ncbi:carboxylate--amine ligase [Salinarchaeum sp. Harcht-Bsk1]|uniref:carboxylate--amine ligase n=1 Tax=Salinarchaeum sp. Harcht-Bsk1 TaxID=1333523 RepID=UPI000A7CC8E2|nr:carboxylate--amine ligase [Salinarchaeum sp. Harcht-Bsk1]